MHIIQFKKKGKKEQKMENIKRVEMQEDGTPTFLNEDVFKMVYATYDYSRFRII